MSIPPIETPYKGFRFRSRLEARWAVFFDAMEIKWEYEPEGFDILGRKYLPDFYLSEWGLYCEVKPSEENMEDGLLENFSKLVERGICLLDGIPEVKLYKLYLPDLDEVYIDLAASKYKDKAWVECDPYLLPYHSERIHHAVTQARSARFEHGEKPSV